MMGTKKKKDKNDSFLSTREAAEISGFSSRHIKNLITRGICQRQEVMTDGI